MTARSRSARLLTLAAPLVETLVNGWLRLDPETRASLGRDAPACIGVDFTDLSLQVFILADRGEIRVLSECALPASAWLRGRVPALLTMLLTERVSEGVSIEGDGELIA